jgi:hypothetical protein
MKVTDKRMFTPDGRLREEYADVVGASDAESDGGDAIPPARSPEPPPAAPPSPPPASAPPSQSRPPLDLPDTPAGMGAPTFYDLVALLAEPISLYLGDLQLPDGGSAENLEMARLHIDLLAVLRQKTAGNLSAQEAGALEDLLYRLRLRYIQKRG